MLGLLVNFIAVIVGSSVGLLLKKGISEKIEHAVMIGIGIMFAAIPITLYQGILAIFAGLISPILVGGLLDAFGCAGSLLTMVIGANMMGISNIKIANYLPVLVLAPLFTWIAMQF